MMTMSSRSLWLAGAVAIALSVATSALAQPFAYVSGVRNGSTRDTQFLTVIDVPTRAKVATIALGESCLCVGERAAVSPDGARVYVSNFWSSTVSVVDTATNAVIRTYPVHTFPGALAASPDGTRLYINTFISRGSGLQGPGARSRVRGDDREHPTERAAERLGDGDFSEWRAPVRDQPGAQRLERQDHRHRHQHGDRNGPDGPGPAGHRRDAGRHLRLRRRAGGGGRVSRSAPPAAPSSAPWPPA